MLDEYYSPNKPMTESRRALYVKTLEDIEVERLELAAIDWVKQGKPFMPKVSELRLIAKNINPGQGRNLLTFEFIRAKDEFYHNWGVYDPDTWEAMIARYKRAGLLSLADCAENFYEWIRGVSDGHVEQV